MFSYQKISLLLLLSASLQAKDMYDVAQELQEEGANVAGFISRNKVFARTYNEVTSLEGLDKMPNISGAWVLNLQGNNLATIDEKTFDKPEFANLRYLDLSNCNIKEIKPGAFKRLKKLYVLFLGDNQLQSFTAGTFRGTKPLYLSIKNNPNTERLKKQAQRQLPKAVIFTGELSFEAKRNIAAAIGAAAVIAGAIVVGTKVSSSRDVEAAVTEERREQETAGLLEEQEKRARQANEAAKKRRQELKEKIERVESGDPFAATYETIFEVKEAKKEAVASDVGGEKKDLSFDTELDFWLAIEEGSEAIAKDLLEKGVDINKSLADKTPLMAAAEKGDKEMVKFLLKNGADPKIKNMARETAADIAWRRRHEDPDKGAIYTDIALMLSTAAGPSGEPEPALTDLPLRNLNPQKKR